jgi:hypothetical protein
MLCVLRRKDKIDPQGAATLPVRFTLASGIGILPHAAPGTN